MKSLHALLGLLLLGACASTGSVASAQPETQIESGRLRGVVENEVAIYRDIPFAAPPVGALRWQPPAPMPHWAGVRDASNFGPVCPQPVRPGRGRGVQVETQSEDCLKANVWAPVGAHNLPVMVWIHGGAHRTGAASFPYFEGSGLARQGVVLVTVDYRLGLLGYFAHPALTAEASSDASLGNYGFMDQIAALEWVQRNIAAFGGDPNRVTIFGESAGGASIIYLLTSPRARGLFQQAIVESGGGLQRPSTLAVEERQGVSAATRIGLPENATAAQLRALPSERWVEALGQIRDLGFGPFIDGRLITEAPSQAFAEHRDADVPLIIGANDNEASLFSEVGGGGSDRALANIGPRLRALYGDVSDAEFQRLAMGDAIFVGPAAWIASQTSNGAPSYLYHFTYVPERLRGRVPGARHGGELPYVFQTLDQIPFSANPSDQDRAFAAMISSCWVSFAKAGHPVCSNGPAWPAYSSQTDQLMVFGPTSQVTQQPRRAAIDVLLATMMGRSQ